jgi:hypothetical protein
MQVSSVLAAMAGAVFAVFFTASTAHGQEFKATIGQTVVPVWRIGEKRGAADLTQEAFAAQVGERLRTFTGETDYEGFGMLCRAPSGQWGSVLTSAHAHSVCPVAHLCPSGFAAVEGIHSHPFGRNHRVNNVDRALLGPSYRNRKGAVYSTEDPDHFSPQDFEAPGYMVSKTRLQHQNGTGTERDVDVGAPAPR